MNEEVKPKSLFHYTTVNVAIEKILPSLALRMNALSKMNDPEENLIHEVEPFNYIQDLNNKSVDYDRFIFAKYIREETFITSFSIEKINTVECVQYPVNGCHLQRMWAQYGGGNTGVCFEIDYDLFVKENKKLITELALIDGKVEYNDYNYCDLPSIEFGMSAEIMHPKPKSTRDVWEDKQKDKKYVENRFFTKNKDWEAESEYRFLTFNKEAQEITLSIKESLVRIHLGVHFSQYYLPSIRQFLTVDKIKALELFLCRFSEKQIDYSKCLFKK